VVVEQRPSPLLGLPRQYLYAARHTAELCGAGANAHSPRAIVALKLAARHADRVSAAAHGAAAREPALAPLFEMQLRLCTHRYSKVRALAQDGYKAALSRHPWVAARQLPSIIGPLSDAAAQPHEAKGAACSVHRNETLIGCHPRLLRPRAPPTSSRRRASRRPWRERRPRAPPLRTAAPTSRPLRVRLASRPSSAPSSPPSPTRATTASTKLSRLN